MSQSHTLDSLIEALRRLPGVGVRSAARMAFHMLQHDREGAVLIAQALQQAVHNVHHCSMCHTFTEAEVCSTCLDPQRDASKLCVIETPADQSAVERTAAYKGLYFVLMGKLSPLGRHRPRATSACKSCSSAPATAWCRRSFSPPTSRPRARPRPT